MTTIAEAATELRELKTIAERQEGELKETKRKIERIEKQILPELMEASGVENSRIPGIGTVYLQNKVFANVKADDREQFHEYLRENGMGELVKETVHPGTLTAWAKEQLEQGKPLPEFVQAAFVTQAALRKA